MNIITTFDGIITNGFEYATDSDLAGQAVTGTLAWTDAGLLTMTEIVNGHPYTVTGDYESGVYSSQGTTAYELVQGDWSANATTGVAQLYIPGGGYFYSLGGIMDTWIASAGVANAAEGVSAVPIPGMLPVVICAIVLALGVKWFHGFVSRASPINPACRAATPTRR